MNPKDTYRLLSADTANYFECQLPILNETEKAICFDTYTGYLANTRPTWIPKSQMRIVDLGKDSGIRYFVKNWLHSKLS